MIGLILLIFLTILLLAFGVFCLIVSLGYPTWYKAKWQKDIDEKLPQDLITKTTIIGAACTGVGFIFGLVLLFFSDSSSTQTYHHHAKKKPGIVLLARKLKKGPSGGSYYSKGKCTGFGKSRKCKMMKIYTK